MRSPAEMTTIQVELTTACVKRCSNCTRFSGTKQQEWFISEDEFHAAIDSLIDYSKLDHALVGMMGGEPLLHPKFAEFCEYASKSIPRDRLGLWSTFPDAPKYKGYAQLICDTFGAILLNDHSRDGILHAPVLMASEEYFKKPCPTCKRNSPGWLSSMYNQPGADCPQCENKGVVTDDRALFQAISHCWVQEQWSASINSKGAWFCEVAAALSDLFDGPEGWKVEPGWWMRIPADFKEQMDWACRKCGAALPLERIRNSRDNRDDVSPGNLERLKAIKSRKVARGEVFVREQFVFDKKLLENHGYPDQSPYQEAEYRQRIAARYGIRLVMSKRGYWEPQMMPAGWKPEVKPPDLFQIMQAKYTGASTAQGGD